MIDDTLTAVDGGTDSTLSKATADVTFAEMAVNFATLTQAVNTLAALHGLVALTDDSGATPDPDGILGVLTAGEGVDNGAAATGTADARC